MPIAAVDFMHEGKGQNMITYVSVILTEDEDAHNFRRNDICLYGKELNITIKRFFDPDPESNSDDIAYGYIIYDGTVKYNEDIIEQIRTNLKNRLLFS